MAAGLLPEHLHERIGHGEMKRLANERGALLEGEPFEGNPLCCTEKGGISAAQQPSERAAPEDDEPELACQLFPGNAQRLDKIPPLLGRDETVDLVGEEDDAGRRARANSLD